MKKCYWSWKTWHSNDRYIKRFWKMKKEKLKELVKAIERMSKASSEYWKDRVGDYHREYVESWCKEVIECIEALEEP